jgi:flavin reductase (DIM6/NTAB) family NADH-FMN oxidoreductase RutF
MACFPTGVTVVAGHESEGEPYGLTVNSFTSVSLQPPLVLVCIARTASSHDRLIGASTFAVSVLSAGQLELARRFAREPSEGRFNGVAWRPSAMGDPILSEAAAWLACEVERVLPGGDHSILVGRVSASGASRRPVLMFHRGRMGSA